MKSLSSREKQVWTLIAQGKQNKEIASILDISLSSVKTYISRLYLKIGARNRADAARLFGSRMGCDNTKVDVSLKDDNQKAT